MWSGLCLDGGAQCAPCNGGHKRGCDGVNHGLGLRLKAVRKRHGRTLHSDPVFESADKPNHVPLQRALLQAMSA